MALAAKLDKAGYDGLAEGLRAAYVADGDGWRLDVDQPKDEDGKPIDYKARVDEFRQNNVALKKAAEESAAKIKTLEEAAAKAAEEKKKADDEATAKLSDTEKALKGMDELRREFEETKKQAAADKAALLRERMTGTIRDAATKAGVRPKAISDVIARARAAGFAPGEDGKPTHGEGRTVADFITGLRADADFLFAPANGDGGGKGTAGTGGGGGQKVRATFAESQDPAWQAANREAVAKHGIEITDARS